MGNKAGVASKALTSQPWCSAAKGVAEHVIKKKYPKRCELIFVSAQNGILKPTGSLAADRKWKDEKIQQSDLGSPVMRHLES